MGRADAMQVSTQHRIRIGGRMVDYRLVHSKAARKLRIRVGPSGVDVVQLSTRNGEELSEFLVTHGSWILEQLDRAERLRSVRRAVRRSAGEILYHGESTRAREPMSRVASNSGCDEKPAGGSRATWQPLRLGSVGARSAST